MELIPLTKASQRDWQAFCNSGGSAWFWQLPGFIEYSLHHRPDLRPESHSFSINVDGKVVAVCPLIMEKHPAAGALPERNEFSIAGSYGIAPAIDASLPGSLRAKVTRAVFDHVDLLARQLSIGRVSMRYSPLVPAFMNDAPPPMNPLTRQGFMDTSIATQVVDLTVDEAALLAGMSKGHRYDVNRGRSTLGLRMYDKQSITPDVFSRYQRLHHMAAGRITRPQATWDLMLNWIKEGTSLLAEATENGESVGFSLLFAHGQAAYYASACNMPGRRDIPIAHVLQWASMSWLKENGYKYYELGWQQYGPLPYDIPSDKDISISLFKRGFGGVAVPLFRGEKYYDRTLYEIISAERHRLYAASIKSVDEAPSEK